jgi:hypothetical protein
LNAKVMLHDAAAAHVLEETRSCGSWLSFVEKWCIIL